MRSYTIRVYQETDDPDYRDALIGIVKDAHGQQCAFMGAHELAQILSQDGAEDDSAEKSVGNERLQLVIED